MITTQKELRAEFWKTHPQYERFPGAKQSAYPTDTRIAWCDFVEHLWVIGEISEALANRATL